MECYLVFKRNQKRSYLFSLCILMVLLWMILPCLTWCVVLQMSRKILHPLWQTGQSSSQFILDFHTAGISISVSEMKTFKLNSSPSYLTVSATRTKVWLSLLWNHSRKVQPSQSCSVKKYLLYSTDFLKKKTCEVKAFLKAIQLYRQEKGQYESWDMLIGSDVRVGVL